MLSFSFENLCNFTSTETTWYVEVVCYTHQNNPLFYRILDRLWINYCVMNAPVVLTLSL